MEITERIENVDEYIKELKNYKTLNKRKSQIADIVYNIEKFNEDKNNKSSALEIQLIDTIVLEIIEKSETELNIPFSEINDFYNEIQNYRKQSNN